MSELPSANIEARTRTAGRLVAACGDILAERPAEAPPRWVIERGWLDFLRGLDDAALTYCEADGLSAHAARLGAPGDLTDLVRAADAVCRLAPLGPPGHGSPSHRIKPRKRRQLSAFAGALLSRELAAGRVVDVGAGHGHLTRHLAEALRVEAVGLERDEARLQTARDLAGDGVCFEAVDLFAEAPRLHPTDLVVGLHACGALTDRLVFAAAECGAAVAFASCCLQKRPEPARAPLVADGSSAGPLDRAALGLANINIGPTGVEASHRQNIEARMRRVGLRALLRGRGVDVMPGDEMHGINRRRAHDDFDAFAAFVLAKRGMPSATAAELRAAEAAGREESGRTRRWSIARRWLGRVVEVYVNCDRALYLERRGYRVELGALWPLEVSPRNVGVIGWR